MKASKFIGYRAIVALLTIFSIPVSQSLATESAEFDKSALRTVVSVCFEDAKEDDIALEELTDYITICIKDELESVRLQKLTKKQILKLLKDYGNTN